MRQQMRQGNRAGIFGGNGQGQGRGGRRLRQRCGWNRPAFAAGGYCVCPSCGRQVPHRRGEPCAETACPQCGTRMMRQVQAA